jgi:hypothetical protein
VGQEKLEGRVAVEHAGEDEARDGDGCLEGEAEAEGENVAVVLLAEGAVDAVVRVLRDAEAW